MSYTSLFYHIVFSTKDRHPLLSGALLGRVCEYMGGIIRNMKGKMLAGNGAADHVHLAAVLHPTTALADALRDIKSSSSRWIHEEFPDLRGFGWQDGYAAFTVSRSVFPDVVAYIRNQEAHHKKLTFQEELLALLAKHGIEYDERYIWS